MSAFLQSFRKESLWILATIVLLILGVGIFLYGDSLGSGIIGGISICINTLIPSLFPFMVLSSFIACSRFSHYISAPFSKPVRAIYHLPSYCSSVILMSMIGGYPVGARMISNLVDDRLLSAQQAEHMLCLCVNASPAFLITGVGVAMFGSAHSGLILLAAHITAALITGVIFRPKAVSFASEPTPRYLPTSSAFVNAVQSSSRGLVGICAFVTLFSGVTAALRTSGIMKVCSQLISGLLKVDAAIGDSIVAGFFEVTTGCAKASSVLGYGGLILASVLCSWGGMSIFCQIMSIVRKNGLHLRLFLVSRVVHCLISGCVTFLLIMMFPPAITVFSKNALYQFQLSSSPMACILLVAMCTMLIAASEKSMEKNQKKC